MRTTKFSKTSRSTRSSTSRKPRVPRIKKRSPKYILPKDAKIDLKNIDLLRRYVTDRGKILSRRVSGVTGKQQRDLAMAIKQARYLGLLPVGGVNRRV